MKVKDVSGREGKYLAKSGRNEVTQAKCSAVDDPGKSGCIEVI